MVKHLLSIIRKYRKCHAQKNSAKKKRSRKSGEMCPGAIFCVGGKSPQAMFFCYFLFVWKYTSLQFGKVLSISFFAYFRCVLSSRSGDCAFVFCTEGGWIIISSLNGGGGIQYSFTTLQSLTNTKLSPHSFWPCHENGLIKTIPAMPHNHTFQSMPV